MQDPHRSIATLPLALSLLIAAPTAALAADEPAPPEPRNYGYDGGFYLRTDDDRFQITVTGLLQPRFVFESTEQPPEPQPADPTGLPVDSRTTRDHDYAFAIPRAQLKVGGHAFSENVAYFLQTELAGGDPFLKDGWIEGRLLPGALHLRVGQMKRPFSRQWMTSAGTLELVERALTHYEFSPGRDLGLMFHNGVYSSPRFEYAIGAFNGTGYQSWQEDGGNTNVPSRFKPTIVARLGTNHGGINGYSEADLEGGGPRFAAGVSGLVELDADDDESSGVRGEADLVFKAHHFSASGAVYVASGSSGDFSDQAFEAIGAHLQAGHVFSGRVQPALRYVVIAPDGANNDTHRILGAVSVYVFGHNLKWQLDGGPSLHERPDGDQLVDYMLRTQLQLMF